MFACMVGARYTSMEEALLIRADRFIYEMRSAIREPAASEP